MKQPPRQFSVAEILDAVPVRNQAARAEVDPKTGGMRLWVPIRKRWFNRAPINWVIPFRDEYTFGIDPLGREVWEACDGQRRVETIIERFAERHRLTFHEARASVMKFLNTLTASDLVVIVGRESGSAAPQEEEKAS